MKTEDAMNWAPNWDGAQALTKEEIDKRLLGQAHETVNIANSMYLGERIVEIAPKRKASWFKRFIKWYLQE